MLMTAAEYRESLRRYSPRVFVDGRRRPRQRQRVQPGRRLKWRKLAERRRVRLRGRLGAGGQVERWRERHRREIGGGRLVRPRGSQQERRRHDAGKRWNQRQRRAR